MGIHLGPACMRAQRQGRARATRGMGGLAASKVLGRFLGVGEGVAWTSQREDKEEAKVRRSAKLQIYIGDVLIV